MSSEVAVPARFEIEVRDIMRDPASDDSRRATELIRNFVLAQARR